MSDQITPPPELVDFWVDLLESGSDQSVFTLAAQWGYKQAVKELEEFLKKIVDTPCSNSMTTQINGDKLFVIDHHPAIPPSDQLKKWEDKWFDEEEHPDVLLIQAFQAGADQELEACLDWLSRCAQWEPEDVEELRTVRRPKPPSPKLPSLKEQALDELHISFDRGYLKEGAADTIRRALEQLDD